MQKNGLYVTVIILVLFAYGCRAYPMEPEPQITENVVIATNTSTVIPSTQTNSPMPPSNTVTDIPPTPTFTTTSTPSLTPTMILSSYTPTQEPPRAALSAHTVCRFGPGTIYPVHTSFKVDGFGWVLGRLEDDSWYFVELEVNGESCWIFNEIVALDKPISLQPIFTPPPKPTPAPAPTQSEEERKLGVKYFLIIPDNGGPFACGDGMAYFYSGKKGNTIEDDITVALNALFSVKKEFVGNYYNPVYQSNLRVKDVEVENGNATIWLGGNFVKPKSRCEAERIHLQVWQTASQFSEITNRPIIRVNNALLGDLLRAVQK